MLVEARSLPPQVEGDQPKLRQVLVNLLGNALKFTHSGEVRIRVGADSATEPGNPVLLRFAITDTGPGIDIDTQQRLFQPFQQGAASDENQAVASYNRRLLTISANTPSTRNFLIGLNLTF